jgi:hypothetical protein
VALVVTPLGPRKLRYAFTGQTLTHFGRVYLLHRFLSRLRLKRRFVTDVRFLQRNNHYSVSEMVLALLYPMMLGLERLEATHLLRHNGVIRRDGSLTAVAPGLRLRHDTGSLFLARHFVGTAQQLAITQEFIPRASPEYNGVIERFFRTLKQECVRWHHVQSFEEADRIITAWIARYNTERQHSALGYLSPRVWREQFYQVPQAA